MGFNRFSKSDGIRIVLILFIVAVIYFGLGTGIQEELGQIFFKLPLSPATVTWTPVPTASPTPTQTMTPLPTQTPGPTPIPTSVFLSGQEIVYWNEFDNTDPLRGDWEFFPNVQVDNGLLIIKNSKSWDGVYGNSHLDNGQTILIQFRFDSWSDLHIAVETGEFDTDAYRSWGVGAEAGLFSPVFSEGKNEYENSFTSDDLALNPNDWYILMLHIGRDGDPFVAKIWKQYDLESSYEFQMNVDESWSGKRWSPLFLVGPTGKLEIQRYEEIK